MKNKTAVIIGAGPAGLTAAMELLEKTDILPIVIESDSQVGGLSRTIDYKGNKIDIGGHRFFSKSDRVIEWWLRFLPLEAGHNDENITLTYQQKQSNFVSHNHDTPSPERQMMIRPRKSRIYFQKKLFDYPLKVNLKTLRSLGLLKTTKILSSYLFARIRPRRPELSLEDFMINRFGQELYQTFFKNYTEKVWGVSCKNLPSDWGKQRIKDLNIGELMRHALRSIFSSNRSLNQKGTSTSLIEQFLYPSQGPGQLWEAVAEQIRQKGGSIYLGSTAQSLQLSENGNPFEISIHSSDPGIPSKIKADYVLSTMPVKHLIAAIKGMVIPGEVQRVASQLAYRDFIIVGILCQGLELQDGNTEISDNWIYIQDDGLKAGRVQFFHNWSPYMLAKPGTKWIGVEFFTHKDEAFWQMTDNEIQELALEEMSKIGIIRRESVLDTTVIRIEKAYPSYQGAYQEFGIVQDWFNKIPNLYLIGRNGMHRYNNSDHSMLTAIASVEAIKSGDQAIKESIWEINAEEDYHEVKSESI